MTGDSSYAELKITDVGLLARIQAKKLKIQLKMEKLVAHRASLGSCEGEIAV